MVRRLGLPWRLTSQDRTYKRSHSDIVICLRSIIYVALVPKATMMACAELLSCFRETKGRVELLINKSYIPLVRLYFVHLPASPPPSDFSLSQTLLSGYDVDIIDLRTIMGEREGGTRAPALLDVFHWFAADCLML
ncbi:hypothetical protein B296_00028780 [Ensete ventricosum]|uniref:Uncharacterized protein n=1 Tax=Ensete ventricosum TaxID=4639 RepID=A0A426Z3F6_ENSVE|nr:hypothetical protein B296_00028780 [Ensete ventricosum]